jgi:6-phosphogluconolactonase (cycloisomerase 2 family)
VANSQSNNISGYSINDATGVLTPLANSPFPAGEQPLSVAVSIGGVFLYAANTGSNSLSVYSIDQSSGALAPVSGSPFPVGQSPGAVLYFQVPQ